MAAKKKKWGGKRKGAGRPRKRPVTVNLAIRMPVGRPPGGDKNIRKRAMESIEAALPDCINVLYSIAMDNEVDPRIRLSAAKELAGKIIPKGKGFDIEDNSLQKRTKKELRNMTDEELAEMEEGILEKWRKRTR